MNAHEHETAQKIVRVLDQGTRDMGGEASTVEFTRAILDKLEEVHKA